MTAQNRYYSNIATVTTLANPGGINGSETDLQCEATTGFPGSMPYTLRIEPDTNLEEAVLVTSGAGTSGTPFQVIRGYDGTQARAHPAGVQVKHGFVQLDFAEPQQHLNLTGSASAAHGLPSSAWLGGTMQLLQTVNLASSTTISFPSIPSTFSKLIIDIYAVSNDGGGNGFSDILMQYNGDTNNHYSYQFITMVNSTSVVGIAVAAVAGTRAGFTCNGGANPTTNPGVGYSRIEIGGYSIASLSKHHVFNSHASSGVGSPNNHQEGSGGGTWGNNTGVISSILLSAANSPGTFAAGSFGKLYAIL